MQEEVKVIAGAQDVEIPDNASQASSIDSQLSDTALRRKGAVEADVSEAQGLQTKLILSTVSKANRALKDSSVLQHSARHES